MALTKETLGAATVAAGAATKAAGAVTKATESVHKASDGRRQRQAGGQAHHARQADAQGPRRGARLGPPGLPARRQRPEGGGQDRPERPRRAARPGGDLHGPEGGRRARERAGRAPAPQPGLDLGHRRPGGRCSWPGAAGPEAHAASPSRSTSRPRRPSPPRSRPGPGAAARRSGCAAGRRPGPGSRPPGPRSRRRPAAGRPGRAPATRPARGAAAAQGRSRPRAARPASTRARTPVESMKDTPERSTTSGSWPPRPVHGRLDRRREARRAGQVELAVEAQHQRPVGGLGGDPQAADVGTAPQRLRHVRSSSSRPRPARAWRYSGTPSQTNSATSMTNSTRCPTTWRGPPPVAGRISPVPTHTASLSARVARRPR